MARGADALQKDFRVGKKEARVAEHLERKKGKAERTGTGGGKKGKKAPHSSKPGKVGGPRVADIQEVDFAN